MVSKREEYEAQFGREYTERKCSQIISWASMLMVAVVMFFAFSCLFTLSPQNMADAKAQKYPGALSSGEPLCLDVGHQIHLCHPAGVWRVDHRPGGHLQIVFGHYLGTLEGLNGLILRFTYKGDKTRVSSGKLNTLSMVLIMGPTWVVAYANPNILDLIEAMGALIIASLLCLLPMYAIRKRLRWPVIRGRPRQPLCDRYRSADHPQHCLQTVLIRLRPREEYNMTEFPVVLVINCGSSSIKFSVLDAASCDCLLNGVAEGHQRGTGVSLAQRRRAGGAAPARLRRRPAGDCRALAQRDLIDSVALIGHRVAHGGDLFTESVIIARRLSITFARYRPWPRCITTPVSAASPRRSGCSRR